MRSSIPAITSSSCGPTRTRARHERRRDPARRRLLVAIGPNLSSRPGWSARRSSRIRRLGLSLGTLATGPLGLASRDDSLGQFTLPRGVAVDGEHGARALDRRQPHRIATTASKATLVALPEVGATGRQPAGARRSCSWNRADSAAHRTSPRSTARLYVADPSAHRVQVFELATLALIRIHDGIADPADVAAAPRCLHPRSQRPVACSRTSHDDELTSSSVVARDGAGTGGDVRTGARSGIASRSTAIERLRDVVVDAAGAARRVRQSPRDGSPRPSGGEIANSAEIRDASTRRWSRWTRAAVSCCRHACSIRAGCRAHDQIPTRVRGASAIAMPPSTLADGSSRVHLADGRVRHRFGPFDADGPSQPA